MYNAMLPLTILQNKFQSTLTKKQKYKRQKEKHNEQITCGDKRVVLNIASILAEALRSTARFKALRTAL